MRGSGCDVGTKLRQRDVAVVPLMPIRVRYHSHFRRMRIYSRRGGVGRHGSSSILILPPFWIAVYSKRKYSWLSLSRTRLSRIAAYLEVKIWSLPKHENLITGNKILWKRGERSNFSSFPQYFRSNFSSFPQYFQHISNFKSPITYTFVKCGCSIYFFLKSANLICRSTDISKYFRESLETLDNESRL